MKRFKEITVNRGRRLQRLVSRLEKYAGFEFRFDGTMHSPTWSGYKMQRSTGEFVIQLFRR